jgi:hypothetical protein
MVKVWRKAIQEADDAKIRNRRIIENHGKMPLVKTDSLIERARKLGIATDMPTVSRVVRRHDLKLAVREESKKVV